ncbi:hypothetical protein LCGC14_1600000 [marine sediment metagenome]|uniref:Uncharacterized protein n=1 Tax=marine sediment metagenome TaxID=412755 RepID=A0A0F9KS36_9ZZZZ
MSDLESPQTYGDEVGAVALEVQKKRSEQKEKLYTPLIKAYLKGGPSWVGISADLTPLVEKLQSETEEGWDEVKGTFLGTSATLLATAAGQQAAKDLEYMAAKELLNEQIKPEMAATLYQRKKIGEDTFLDRMGNFAYDKDESAHLYKSTMPYPSIPELFRYGRYESSPDNPKPFVLELFDIPNEDLAKWEWLSLQKPTTEQTQTMFRRGKWDDARAITELTKLGWKDDDREVVLELAHELPNAMLLMQGDIYQGIRYADLKDNVTKAGIHPDYASKYIDGVLTKPNTADIIAHQLRFDPSLSGLDDELLKTGIHPDYLQLYKTLAYPIPPVADLITMAVREAFTPDIAARFGQYEDLPKEYVNAAQQKGLSKEWAERYWAAHWDLPSIQQGFAMLHRGIISESDLNMLLRALDIMPFWRDKLMALSYKPLTRVDVRRMHQLGTLDEGGVKKAYQDGGYNDYNAGRMTDFTIRYNRRILSGFTPRDAVNAYINRLIEASECRNLLSQIGTKESEIPNILNLASNKRAWKMKTEQIDAISNLYRKGKYDYGQARSMLGGLGLASDYVKTLLEQWAAKSEADKTATFTNAQTLKLFAAELIDEVRAREELTLLGFNTERIDLLIKSVSI